MSDEIKRIRFDAEKHPGIGFDVFPVQYLFARKNLDHDPGILHRVNFYILILITKGFGKHTIDFVEYNLNPGTVLMIRKDQVHKFHENDAEGIILLFTEEFLLSFLEQSESEKIIQLFNELLGSPKLTLSKAQLESYLTLIEEIKGEFQRQHDAHTSSIIRSLLQTVTNKLFRIKTNQQAISDDQKYLREFLKFQQLVEENCTKSKSVQYYADLMSITPKTLNNITHVIAEKSAKNFIDEVLTMQIKRFLINTSLSVKEIAYQSGFDEPTNLFKFFKKNTSLTPEGFRNMHTG